MNRRKRMMEDLEQDIRDYLERETQDNIERGMPPEEARYAALRKFGNAGRRRPLPFEVCEFAKRNSWGDVRCTSTVRRSEPRRHQKPDVCASQHCRNVSERAMP